MGNNLMITLDNNYDGKMGEIMNTSEYNHCVIMSSVSLALFLSLFYNPYSFLVTHKQYTC